MDPNEIRIPVVRKQGRKNIVWQLALPSVMDWTPEGHASEKELVALLAEQRSASEDDFALKILIILRLTIFFFIFIVRV